MDAVDWSTVKVLLPNIKSVHRAGRESQLPATVLSLPSTALTATSGVEPQTQPHPHAGCSDPDRGPTGPPTLPLEPLRS